MKQWIEDIYNALEKDPAARSFWEVYFTYNGIKALRMHRRAHRLYAAGHLFRARRLAARCTRLTGVDIHPGATIGHRCFIDHGVGVVIGETSVIGDDVVIYQGVTLGGTGKDVGKRHPTVQDRVMISAGAKVLGPLTVGHDSKIGAGSVVLKDVPPHSTVVGVPGRVVKTNNVRVADMDHVHIPDPILDELCRLNQRIVALEQAQGIDAAHYSIAEHRDVIDQVDGDGADDDTQPR